ncbi:ATP-binding protein [Gloeothece verrucosa]|uniref:ORC1/DEAH AAA+ ATPase domain-containing protein n=1 Tax=Gloeothece verrucosa (strain PCC 7822) TaxID=497965 RepID=E0UMH5_GLOV7|nr:ATP-binding protein [Gloeothece verrucosa]ADN18155.1 conserved hypothetical protein [Gloeothece verrucosa PCC 7822]
MKVKLSETGHEQIKTRWTQKQKEGWTREHLCTEASQFAEPDTPWKEFFNVRRYALNCTPETLDRFLRGEVIQWQGFLAFCQALNIEPSRVAELDNLLEKLTQNIAPIWVGRESVQSELLNKLKGDCRIMVITGITGIGKTALAYKLAEVLCQDGFPPEVPIDFDGFNQPDNQQSQPTAQNFTSVAIELLHRVDEPVTGTQAKNPQQLLNKLVDNLVAHRRLIWLDSVENLLEGKTEDGSNRFKDPLWRHFFQKIVEAEAFPSRIVITSQDKPADFKTFGQTNYWHIEAITGLNAEERIQLFQRLFEQAEVDLILDGTNRAHLKYIGEIYEGHPLALRLIAGDIINRLNGNIVRYWEENKDRFRRVKRMIDEAEQADINDYYKTNILSNKSEKENLIKKILEEEIQGTIDRLESFFETAYLLLIYGSVYPYFELKQAWFFQLQLYLEYEEEALELALLTLFNRYLVEIQQHPGNEIHIKQHNLIRNVAFKNLKTPKNKRDK